MKSELVKYGLRSSNRAGRRSDVLQVVQIATRGAISHYCYIKFSDDFVSFVGSKLPQGVSPGMSAYISVDVDEAGTWHIYAGYWAKPESSRVLLWSTTERPGWLKFYKLKRPKNDSSATPLDITRRSS
jgi:hypothetical protein